MRQGAGDPKLMTDPFQELSEFVPDLRGRDLTQLAAALRQCIDPVIDEHVEALRRRIDVTRQLERVELVNDLRDVLHDVVDAMTKDVRELELRSPAHGVARFTQSFEVEHLGIEYTLLRGVLATHLRSRLGRSLTDEEADSLHAVVDFINSRVTSAFQHQKEKHLRLETDAISRFLSALAHDLRNSLGGAMLTMQMVSYAARNAADVSAGESVTPAKLQQLVRDVEASRRAIEATMDAMTQLLEAERLRVGSVTIRPEPVAVGSLIESIGRSAWRGVPGAHGRRETPGPAIDVPADLVADTDYSLLSTVLLNLVSNAVKYGGGKPVEIRAFRLDDGGCRIDVRDHGAGIPPGELSKLFQQYYRADPRGSAGLGLGLFTARRAAELMGAELSVESTPGVGSTFSLVIPAAPPERVEPRRRRAY